MKLISSCSQNSLTIGEVKSVQLGKAEPERVECVPGNGKVEVRWSYQLLNGFRDAAGAGLLLQEFCELLQSEQPYYWRGQDCSAAGGGGVMSCRCARKGRLELRTGCQLSNSSQHEAWCNYSVAGPWWIKVTGARRSIIQLI